VIKGGVSVAWPENEHLLTPPNADIGVTYPNFTVRHRYFPDHRSMNTYFTYMTTNRKRGIIYTGMTNNIVHRMDQHRNKTFKGFTSRYNLDKLVWYEEFEWVQDAIAREKQIKGWMRTKKITLIEKNNPNWDDLYDVVKRIYSV
jgi:putative endonuclease